MLKGHCMSNGPKFQMLGHERSQILMIGDRYIWDKIMLKISAQTDNPFKRYDTSKLAW